MQKCRMELRKQMPDMVIVVIMIRLYFMKQKSFVKQFQTIKNIPEAETISRLHLSANAW